MCILSPVSLIYRRIDNGPRPSKEQTRDKGNARRTGKGTGDKKKKRRRRKRR
jgi:hypothetical protein